MIRDEIKKLIKKAVKSHWGINLGLEEIKIECPPEEFGDYSTNVALSLAKAAKSNPMEVAEDIAERLRESNLFGKIEVAKPGFVNFYLSKSVLQKEVGKIEDQKENYGDLDVGKGEKVQVEFISANPTGPLTLGNGRGGFYGDVLANVLNKAGFEVEKEYYINDIGEQIKKLGHSVLGDEQVVYKGEYVERLRAELDSRLRGNDKREGGNEKKGNGNNGEGGEEREESDIEEIGKEAAKFILDEMIKSTVEKKMKIRFNNWFSEASLYEKNEVDKVLNFLKEKNLAYEQDGALWFKSTQFGDDKDRVLVKADGEKTYLASDIAYLKNKFERGFEKLIYIWGADHHGYIGRLKAAASALGYDPDNVQIIIMQLVRLLSGGKEVRMSKRTGTYVTLDELIDEVGLDAARFFFLMRGPDSHLNFDMDLAKEQSEKNPVYYVQYASARIHSILRKVQNNFQFSIFNFQLLSHKSELKLIKQLIRFSEVVEDTALDYQVHRLPHYALDLVRVFHKFYEDCRVIDEKAPELTQARLALVKATQIVLKNTLELMGVFAPERM